jgi:hypothetical protein
MIPHNSIYMKINSVKFAIRLCKEKEEGKTFLPSTLKYEKLRHIKNEDFKPSSMVKSLYRFFNTFPLQIANSYDLYVNHQKIESFCGNRKFQKSSYLKQNYLSIFDPYFVPKLKCIGYKVKRFNLAKLCIQLGAVELTADELNQFSIEQYCDENKPHKLTDKIINSMLANVFKRTYKGELAGEKDFDYKHHETHDRIYNAAAGLNKQIKYLIFNEYSDLDITCAQPNLVKELCLQMCLSGTLGKRQAYRNKIKDFAKTLEEFDIESIRIHLGTIIGEDAAKILINSLFNSARFNFYYGSTINHLVHGDLTLFQKLRDDTQLKHFRTTFKQIWDIIYKHYEEYTGTKIPAMMTKPQVEKSNASKIRRIDEILTYGNKTEKEKEVLHFKKRKVAFSESRPTRKNKWMIACCWEKKVMDIVSDEIKKEDSSAIILREHDGLKCNIKPDVANILGAIKQTLGFNLSFKANTIKDGELIPF